MNTMRLAAAVVLGMACSAARADVKLASVFSDHMVIQRDKPVTIWGTATPGKAVTVKFADETASTKSDASGHWTIRMAGQPASDTAQPLSATEDGANTVALQDVLVGDVWICSGQSNMEFALPRASNAAEAVRGTVLHATIAPDEVPEDPEEYYDHQLVGLSVVDLDGTALGEVKAVVHGAAQDLLSVRTADGRDALVPFVSALVPEVDLEAGRVVVADRPGLVSPFADEQDAGTDS